MGGNCMTLHTQLLEFVNRYGCDTLLSPVLPAILDDERLFKLPENRHFKNIFRQMSVNGDLRQIIQQWNSTIPNVASYSHAYPMISNDDLRYTIESLGYAMGKIDDVALINPTNDPKITQAVSLEDDTVEYISHGSKINIGTLIPAVMASPVHRHLNAIANEEGSVAEYVRREMCEPDTASIMAKISGEQIDGVALAMRQMKEGRAFILGDMTGIGKGRQLAMLLKWSKRQGYKPVFVTEKSTLFNDLFRDLFDVGYGDMRPFILNSDKDARITDCLGRVIYGLPSAAELQDFKSTGTIPPGYDFLLTTYSQLNKTSTKSWKSSAVLLAIKDSYLLLDESHNASGIDSNIGEFFRNAVKEARAVCFASATYAKNPSSMPIYAMRTAMSDAKIPAADLLDIVAHGGPILQEEMSRGLVESGSMIRRQRDMSDVVRVLDTPTDTDTIDKLYRQYDRIIDLIDDIRDFHDRFIKPYYESIDIETQLEKSVKKPKNEVWLYQHSRVIGWKPQVRLAPTIRQLLFSLKTEQAIDKTIEELRAGHKPIVQISRTMASNIARILKVGEKCDTPDFVQILRCCVDDMFQYELSGKTSIRASAAGAIANSYSHTYKYGLSDVIDYYNSLEWKLSHGGSSDTTASDAQDCYDMLLKNIDSFVNNLPLSPIDYFVQRLNAEGYRVGELTQRSTQLVYDDVTAGINSSVSCRYRKQVDKKRLAEDFNNGIIDVLIGNRVMASGISLHSSNGFSDTRPRTVITWEQQDSADIQTQFDGRADRTGQLHRCKYIVLISPIPTERRFLMINSRKQHSLNANVEANQGRDYLCADIFNKYGASIIDEFANDNPEYIPTLYSAYKKDVNGKFKKPKLFTDGACAQYVSDLMRDLGLLSCGEQENVLGEILCRYEYIMNSLDESGENELHINVLPLQASLVNRVEFVRGNDSIDSPFAQSAYLDLMDVNVLRKPLTSEQATETMSTLKSSADLEPYLQKALDERIEGIKKYYSDLRDRALQQLSQLKALGKYTPSRVKELEERANNIKRMELEIEAVEKYYNMFRFKLNSFNQGQCYCIPSTIVADGVVQEPFIADRIPVGLFMGYKMIGSKCTRSVVHAVFAVNDGRSVVRIPMSDNLSINVIVNQSLFGYCLQKLLKISLENWDSIISTGTRERAYIITGNILAGIAHCKECQRKVRPSPYKSRIVAMANGRMVKYTDIDGKLCTGYLLPRSFSAKEFFYNIS